MKLYFIFQPTYTPNNSSSSATSVLVRDRHRTRIVGPGFFLTGPDGGRRFIEKKYRGIVFGHGSLHTVLLLSLSNVRGILQFVEGRLVDSFVPDVIRMVIVPQSTSANIDPR